MVKRLVHAHERLPLRPFRHQLYRLYRVYVSRQSNRVVDAEIDGVRYRLDLGEKIDSEIYFRGAYEPVATMAVKRIVRPGMTVFDVGANIGYFSLLFARLVGGSGSVIAFEPTTWAFEKLSANIALNAFRNVSAERLALSDVAHSREARSEQTAFRASWPVSGPVARRDPEVVTFVPLDSYVAQLEIKHVDLIKIDVDGYELRVLRGALETLRRWRPPLLLEIGRETMKEVGDAPEELVDVLDKLGYTFRMADGADAFPSGDAMLRWLPKGGGNVWVIPGDCADGKGGAA